MHHYTHYWVNRLDPMMIHIHGDFGIRYYGLAYLLAFIIGALLLLWYYRAGKSPLDPHRIETVMVALIIGVLVGGRMGHVILYAWPEFVGDPWMAFRIWDGGMASHGGFIGVALALVWVSFKFKLSFLRLGDLLSSVVPVGLFLGRVANFINGELWGKVTTVPWAVIFPNSAPPGTPLDLISSRHPSQLYEAALEGVVLLAYTQWRLWRTNALKTPGRLSGEFLILYAIVRIVGEQFREPDAGLIIGMSRGIFFSIFLLAAGVLVIFYASRRHQQQLAQRILPEAKLRLESQCPRRQDCMQDNAEMIRRNWSAVSDKALTKTGLTREDALAVLRADEGDLLEIIAAAYRLRRKAFGRRVNLHVIQNARSGACSENCGFCSQSAASHADIDRYPLRSANELVDGARQASAMGAVKYCVVTSGRAPNGDVVETMCVAARRIRSEGLTLSICVSLGLATDNQLRRLAEAGVNRYNHNLETARRYFPHICNTHSYDDRINTVRKAQKAGLEICCGGIIGMGETLEDRVDLALTLRELGVDSIPVNFFNPRPGTPLEHTPPLTALEALRTLAMFRLVNPRTDIRAAGGREICLGPLQPLALFAANSIFTEGYLTTPGQGNARDLEMIKVLGFEVACIEA